MQDNLPQDSTASVLRKVVAKRAAQTDETHAREVIQADEIAATAYLNGVEERLKSGVKVIEVLPCEDGSPHPLALAFARHRATFAAPPAVEREGAHWAFGRTLDLIDSLYREYGVTLDSTDKLVAQQARNIWLAAPTLHPSDREAIAREGFDAAVAAIQGWADEFAGCDTGKRLRATAADLEANRSAILALSGSLAPVEGNSSAGLNGSEASTEKGDK